MTASADDPNWVDPLTKPHVAWTRADSVTAGILAFLFAVYLAYTWGVVHAIWGDFGEWVAAVSRASQGEVPWRDFTWPALPLALYAYGLVGALFGPTLLTFRVLSILICVLILASHFLVSRELVPKSMLPWLMAPTSILAIAQSRIGGEDLTTGMYTPAASVGLLFACLGLLSAIKLLKGHAGIWLLVAGLAVFGGITSKQDFWLPSVAVAAVLVWVVAARAEPSNRLRAIVLTSGALASVCLAPFVALFVVAGPQNFVDGIRGYQPSTVLYRLLPSWPFLLDQVSVPITWAAILLLVGRIFGAHASWRLVGLAIAGAGLAWLARVGLTYWIAYELNQGRVVPGADHPGLFVSTVAMLQISEGQHGLGLLLATLRVVGVGMLRNWVGLSSVAVLVLLWLLSIRSQITGARKVIGAWGVVGFVCAWALLVGARRLFENLEPADWLIAPVLAYVVLVSLRTSQTPRAVRGLRVGARVACTGLLVLAVLSFGWFEVIPRFVQPYTWLATPMGSVYTTQRAATEFIDVMATLGNPTINKQQVLSVPYEGVTYALNARNPSRLLFVLEGVTPTDGLERELEGLPAGTWLVMDCSAVECPSELPAIQGDAHRTWQIVRTPDAEGRPSFLVGMPPQPLAPESLLLYAGRQH